MSDNGKDRLIILGYDVGVYEGWDEGDPGTLMLNGVESSVLPYSGNLYFDFNTGECIAYKDDGDEAGRFDIISVFSKLQK